MRKKRPTKAQIAADTERLALMLCAEHAKFNTGVPVRYTVEELEFIEEMKRRSGYLDVYYAVQNLFDGDGVRMKWGDGEVIMLEEKDLPKVAETRALAKICGCENCPTCHSWQIYRYVLGFPVNEKLLSDYLTRIKK